MTAPSFALPGGRMVTQVGLSERLFYMQAPPRRCCSPPPHRATPLPSLPVTGGGWPRRHLLRGLSTCCAAAAEAECRAQAAPSAATWPAPPLPPPTGSGHPGESGTSPIFSSLQMSKCPNMGFSSSAFGVASVSVGLTEGLFDDCQTDKQKTASLSNERARLHIFLKKICLWSQRVSNNCQFGTVSFSLLLCTEVF